MSDVSIFDLEGTSINVKDGTARTTAGAAASQAAANALAIQNLEQLARLTVSYDSSTETISFTTQTP